MLPIPPNWWSITLNENYIELHWMKLMCLLMRHFIFQYSSSRGGPVGYRMENWRAKSETECWKGRVKCIISSSPVRENLGWGNGMENRDGQMVMFRGKGLGTKPSVTPQAKLHTITAIPYFYPLGRVEPCECIEIEKSIVLLLRPLSRIAAGSFPS